MISPASLRSFLTQLAFHDHALRALLYRQYRLRRYLRVTADEHSFSGILHSSAAFWHRSARGMADRHKTVARLPAMAGLACE